ncbi:MAG: Na+/H+ antiporter subunit E [Streptosporangiaceae bacterium]|nr:Na+/H+ antiporter subunit E [Streptosporangiaceae bacterium]MBV9855926.1 Na+/H+ antiporter subunit E [Streptosporangiaceae bacterium]
MTQPTRVAESEPTRREAPVPVARRVGAWVVWWIVLMSFWVMLDDSIQFDEMLAGAGAAALAALAAEVVTYQAAARFRMRAEWLAPALRLPGQVAGDLITVFGALWRKLILGRDPRSEFAEIPVRYGDDTVEGATRRVLLVGGYSIAPNQFVLGIDKDLGAMVVHRLESKDGGG